MKPCVVALIFATAVKMLLTKLTGIGVIGDSFVADIKGVIILAVIITVSFLWKKIKKKKLSPILLILFSALLGMFFYSI